jgi:hypothetical protein
MQNRIATIVTNIQRATPLPPFADLDVASKKHIEREALRLGASDAEAHYNRLRENIEAATAEAEEVAAILAEIRRI